VQVLLEDETRCNDKMVVQVVTISTAARHQWLNNGVLVTAWWTARRIRDGCCRRDEVWSCEFSFFLKKIESMASVSLQPRQKRDLWLRVMTEAKRGAFWPRFNMPRFLNRGRISKITGAKRGYCTSEPSHLKNHEFHFFKKNPHQDI